MTSSSADAALIRALLVQPTARGCWRAGDGYLLEVDGPTAPVVDAARAALATDTTVAAFTAGDALTAAQEHALVTGELLFDARGGIHLAWLYGPTGARFAHDHPTVDDPGLRDLLVGYLESGWQLFPAAPVPDVVDPARGEVVPAGYRYDGRWIWSEAVAYHLAEHHLTPQPELIAHIAATGPRAPDVDPVAALRAVAWLRRLAARPA